MAQNGGRARVELVKQPPSPMLFLLSLLAAQLLLLPETGICEPASEAPFTHIKKNATVARPSETVRICTWNIEWFPAGQRDSRQQNVNWQIAAVSSILNEIAPDILLTQETRNLKRLLELNRNLNPPGFSHLASSLFYMENTEDRIDDRIRQELGILSRFPWLKIREIDFRTLERTNRPARGWLCAHYEFNGRPLVIYNGHLKSNYGAENPRDRAKNIAKRQAAIQELSADLNRQGLDPYRDRIVVVGDFNSDYFSRDFSDEKLFATLESMGFQNTFLLTPKEQRITIPAREGEPWPDGTFDYIFISSGWKLEKAAAKVLPKGASKRKEVYGGDEAGLASDHYPVFIDLPLTPVE